MWWKQAQLFGDNPEPEYSNDPAAISSQPVALDISSDVAQKAKQFASNGKPINFYENGKHYLIIHGSPDGYFNTGEPQINSNDGNPTNDGFIHKDQVGEWMKSKGWGNVNIIACYGGRMEPLNFSGGTAKSYFKNKGKIGFSTYQDPQGNNKLLFSQ